MAQQYTVKAGDTLSKIGQQYGVDYNQISGYRSGNPNLIYPGEVLSIPVDSLGESQTPANIPQQTQADNSQIPGILASGNAMAGGTGGQTDLSELFKQYLGNQAPPPSTADAYSAAYDESGKGEAQKKYNEIAAQLADINAQAQAASQTLESEAGGKDITTQFLGRQQQEVSRQLAIKSLPLQAQLSAAQGNLQMAEDKLNTLYQLKSQDAQNQYNYRTKLIDAVYDFATKQEQARLDQKRFEDEQAFTLKRDELAREHDIALKQIGLQGTGVGTGGGGATGELSTITQAIIDNPNLINSLTPTVKGQVISELQGAGYDVSALGGKPLSDTAIKELTQTGSAIENLNSLKDIINNNLQYVGPISGWQKLNPWSKARQVQADIDRVRQVVGKALEGGVLRKEDEEKYKKILATITDTPETAIYKINQLIGDIQGDIDEYTTLQQGAGRSLDITTPLSKGQSAAGTTSGGNSYTITK